MGAIFGGGVQVVKGLGNRVPLPKGGVETMPGFIVVTPLFHDRLRTNIDLWNTDQILSAPQTCEQGLQARVQIDCFGTMSEDWANLISTLWRDQYGCSALNPICSPLYADDPRQIALEDSEAQYEERWCIDARLQTNVVVTISQQFAIQATPKLIDIH